MDSPFHHEVHLKIASSSQHNYSMERFWHTAWTPPSLPDSIVLLGGGNNNDCGTACNNAEIWPGEVHNKLKAKADINLLGRKTFELRHNAYSACGISDGDTIVMTGGGSPFHNYAHRCAS